MFHPPPSNMTATPLPGAKGHVYGAQPKPPMHQKPPLRGGGAVIVSVDADASGSNSNNNNQQNDPFSEAYNPDASDNGGSGPLTVFEFIGQINSQRRNGGWTLRNEHAARAAKENGPSQLAAANIPAGKTMKPAPQQKNLSPGFGGPAAPTNVG